MTRLLNLLDALPAPLLRVVDRRLRALPFVRRRMEKHYDDLLAGAADALHPYRETTESYSRLPAQGRSRDDILHVMASLQQQEAARWRDGQVSGAVYHGDPGHIDFLNQVYALHSQTNPLHADLWPSITKYEAEMVAMTAHMLGGNEHVCGVVSSGGTESIMLAIKTYREWARDRKGIRRPNLVVPITAHAAFDKAASTFNIRLKRVPVGDDFRADVQAMRRAINRNTIAIVGSAPTFPHGVIDPIAELAALARERGIGMHVDACLGGFVLPWARELGYPVPPFDFGVEGVTSISADTHKYGFAAKGSSIILYRSPELRRYQYYTIADWPGGLYFSPTFAGSRSGALSAMGWAALVSQGTDGYREATRRILASADTVKRGIAAVPGLRVLGDPLFVIAFTADGFDIYRVLDQMTARGWSLNGLHHPAALHICVTLRHTQTGVTERFLSDLHAAVEHVRHTAASSGGMAPIYGTAATMPLKGVVDDILKKYIDLLYKTG